MQPLKSSACEGWNQKPLRSVRLQKKIPSGGLTVRSYFIVCASLLPTGSSLIRDSSVLITTKGLCSSVHGLASQRPCVCSDLEGFFLVTTLLQALFPFGPFFLYFLPLCSSALPCPTHSSLRFSS